jgi:hypothetical protein
VRREIFSGRHDGKIVKAFSNHDQLPQTRQ